MMKMSADFPVMGPCRPVAVSPPLAPATRQESTRELVSDSWNPNLSSTSAPVTGSVTRIRAGR